MHQIQIGGAWRKKKMKWKGEENLSLFYKYEVRTLVFTINVIHKITRKGTSLYRFFFKNKEF